MHPVQSIGYAAAYPAYPLNPPLERTILHKDNVWGRLAVTDHNLVTSFCNVKECMAWKHNHWRSLVIYLYQIGYRVGLTARWARKNGFHKNYVEAAWPLYCENSACIGDKFQILVPNWGFGMSQFTLLTPTDLYCHGIENVHVLSQNLLSARTWQATIRLGIAGPVKVIGPA